MHFISQPILSSADISNTTPDYRLPIIERTENEPKHNLINWYSEYGKSIIYQRKSTKERQYGTAAKTSTYYALAPFIGALLSIVMLGEPVTWLFMTASVIMAVGCWIAAK
jgi:hypothetical protein